MKTSTNKVCANKLSNAMKECIEAWNDIELFGASALDRYMVIANHILSGAVRQVDVVTTTGAPKSDVSMAVAIANAQVASESSDNEYDWREYTSLRSAYNDARVYMNGGVVPAKRKKTTTKTTTRTVAKPADVVKQMGKSEAKKFALAILALV